MIADMPKPSKKATVDELRGGLAKLGLDTKGKKETLWRWVVLRLDAELFRALHFSEPGAWLKLVDDY
jgi:hypothetical protein